MKKRVLFRVLAITGAAATTGVAAPSHAAPPTGASMTPEQSAAVDDVRVYFDRLGRLGFEGVLLLARGDDVVLTQGVGLANHETGAAWSCDTVSTVGSITKQFTAAAIMRLQEQGKLSVDDTLAEWFPDAPEDKCAISLHQLLTHTAGFPDALGDDEAPIGRDAFVEMAFAAPLIFAPGARYEYSNVGYSVLGAVVEKASGEGYEEYLRRELLVPAGCMATGYLAPEFDESTLAVGYREGETWGTVFGRNWRDDGPGWHLRCNGGVHSTANDMLRWVNALRHAEVLSKESLDRMWANHADEGGGESFYGYGWVMPALPWGKFVTHNGGNRIFFADVGFQAEPDGWFIFLMTNRSWDNPGSGQLMGEIGRRLIAGMALPELPDAKPLSASDAQRYAGAYTLGGADGVVTIEVGPDATLEALVEGQRAYALMNGATPSDAATIAAYNEKMRRVIMGIIKHDYQPLTEAYGGRFPIERLRDVYEQRSREQEQEFGAVTGFEIIGGAPLHGGYATLVRLDRARGSTWHRYQWTDEGVLDGQFPMMQAPRIVLRHVGDGEFVAWTLRDGTGARVRIDAASGAMTLGVGTGGEAKAQRR